MAFTSSLYSAPSANTAAAVTLSAVSSGRQFKYIYWSYSGTPAGGSLTITNGGTTVFKVFITSAGAGFIPFPGTEVGSANAVVVATLAAGGDGISGTLTVAE